jgi:hypothetical protein
VREIDFIVIVLKLTLESQGLVETTAFLFHWVLVVADVMTLSWPADIF